LLTANYPAVHTVGRAAARPPVLIDLAWEPPTSSSRKEGSTSGSCSAATQLPLVALVGKGVCFDTGGLNIKTGQGMKLMKKVGFAAFLLLCNALCGMRQQACPLQQLLCPCS